MERLLRLNDFVIVFLVCTHLTMVSGLPPDINIPRNIIVKEDVPIGSIIGSFTAIDPEGLRHINVVTRSTSIIRIEESTTQPGNWSIILNTTLDRETTTSYVLSFTADTNGPLPLSLSMNMFVQDVNDVHPRFENLPYYLGIKEDTLSGQIVYTRIAATDPDNGTGGEVKYYLQDVTQRSAVSSDALFSIDVNSGNISFDGHLDYETIEFYHYKVTAVDGGNLSATTDLFFTVTDVQDTEPYFSGLPYMHSLPENTLSGTSVYKVKALDGDTGVPNNVTYSFVSADPVSCSSFFGIDSATGVITVTSDSLDRDRPPFLEKNGVCEFIVQAVEISTDPGPRLNDRAACTLTLTVTDVNDNVPTFSNNRFMATITENSGPGTPLTLESGIHISVWDADQGANSDFILGLSNSCLSITPTDVRGSANIILLVSNSSCFDFEVLETMTFRIIATYNDGNTTYTDVDLQVINTNDNSPVIQEQLVFPSIPEDSSTSTTVVTIQATDADDKPPYNFITYSLQGGDDMFVIGKHTGIVTVNRNGFDYETRTSYTLIVEATDEGGLRDSATLIVNITDVNDNEPIFKRPEYQAYVTENTTGFDRRAFLKVEATDEDEKHFLSSRSSNIRYSFVPTPWSSYFSINETTGDITLTTRLDYERTGASFILTVQAADRGSPEQFGFVNVTINVQDKNDVDPHFDQNAYSGNVSENAGSDQSVTLVSASDGDGSAPNNVVFYVLESGGSDNFRVNITSGLITVGLGAILDREKAASYSLIILTVDRGDPPLSSTTTVSISLIDVNDEPPNFNDQTYEFSIYENASVGDVNFVITANDPDTNHDLVYSLLLNESQAFTDRDVSVDSSIFGSWFNISSSTGSIRVTSTLDREKAEMVILKIAVTDRNGLSNLPQTAKTSLRITLRDINDNKPIITPTGVLNVSESLTIGTEVTTLTAVDLDKDQTVSFFVSDKTSFFQITSDGKVFVNRSLDRETSATLEFTVYAKDNGQPSMTSNITIHVNVIDKNDNDPEIANTVLIFNVSEGASNGTVFGVISATDKDEGPNAMLTFGFSDIVNDFSINETTGELSVKRNLDRESLDIYKIGIIALDNPTTDVSRRASKQITINILDTNDNFPKFVNFDPNIQSYLGTVIETEPVNSSVTKMNPTMITATDKDVGENARLSYNMHSVGGADYFIINPNSGVITVNASIVGHAGLYNYILTVTDHGSVPLTVSANLTIKVVDVNLNKPIFRDNAPRIVVAECAPIGSSIYTFTADDADPDKESNGKVLYILGNSTTSPADANHFHLNEETGLLTSAATFDREIQSSFRISVTARDLGVPYSLETILSDVEIVLQDENDNPPVFNITRYTFEISESQMSGEVGTVVARDPDNDARTCYSIISGETVMSNYFSISTNTSNQGVLTLVKPLDREKLEQVTFVFSVTANDCSPSSVACKNIMSGRTSVTEVNITVLDVNDNPPNFTQPEYSRGFMTSADFGHVIFNLQELVTDPDTPPNRVHAFYPLGPLEMDQTLKNIPSVQNLVDPLILTKNGTVLTNVKFPADAQGLYKWRVIANDSAGNSTTLLKIYIVGEDKLVRITLFETEDRLRTNQFNIVRDISQQTGYDIVADDIKPFLDTNGNVDPSKSQLLIHAVTSDDSMLEASRLLQQMNQANDLIQNLKTSYQVLSIQSASMDGVNVDGCTCVLNNMTTSFISEETTTPVTSTPLITTTSSTPKITTPAATPSPSCNTTGGARKLFTLTQSNFDLNSSSTSLLVINSHLDLSNIGNNPSVKLALYPPDSFLQIQTTDNKTFSVYTTSVMPEVTKNYHFFLEAEVMAGNETARDFAHLTINVKRVFSTSPPVRVSFVLDGMRKGGIIYDLSSVLGNVEGLGLTLSSNPNTNLYVFSPNQTSIVCNRDVRLSEFRSNADSIAHQHVLTVSTSQGTVLTLHAVIVLNRYSKQIPEVSPIGTLVADFASLSNDFSISGVPTTDQIFVLTSTKVTLGQKLNYENPAEKQFKFNISLVLKSNGEIKTEIETEVIVTDVNDEPPEFKRYIYPFSTWTGAVRNPVIGFLEVTDKDSVSGFSYFIEPIEYSKYFEVLSTNGVLQSKDDLKNLGSSVTFNVSVSDGLNGSKQSAKVTISIFQSQNDNLTVVGNSTVVSVQEEEPPGKLITNASMANYIGYRLLPDYNGSYVTIDAGTGVITTTARLDREDSRMPQLIFSVLAYHKDNTCDFKIVRKITIVITDINDNAPAFTWEGNYSTSLPENSSIGTTVFQVLASDKDLGNNASILFNLYGQSSAPFSIGSQSGIITVANSSLLDREQNETIRVVVIAMDGGSPQRSATATLTIRLTDVNDNSPVFDKTQYTFSILENLPAPVTLGNVSATDKDIGLNGEIGYFYNGPDYFEVDRVSGVIRTTRPLDRELTTKYSLTIYAYDNGSPRREGSCTVMITVNDVNDNAPKFERQYYLINISEANDCFHSAIATLHANDSDEGLNSQVFYTITNTLLSVLTINSSTGMITCKASGLDYEIPDERDFTVQVTATDRGSPPLNGSVTVRVKLTDVNDNAPVFTGHPYNVSLPSEIFGSPNATVYVVSATDRDSNENGAVFYTLTTTDAEVVNLLWMDTNTGVIRVNKTSSTFQSTSHEFLVVASDRGHPPRTDNTSLILNVLNNEDGETIKFSQSDFHITIEEEKPPNVTSSVGKLESSPPGLQAKFTLAKNSVLYVNTSSGDLFCNVTLDRETLATYEILATVADNTSHSYAIVFVTVSDVNDHRPKFLLSEIQMVTDIQENSLIGTSIFIITAEDADAGNNSVVSYYLPETNIPFAVGVSDGQLTVNGSLDREWLSFYTVVVVAKDNGFPPLDTSATVTIYITDDNDNAPTFLPPEITPIPEDASWNRPTWSAVVKATDPDYGVNGTVKYTVLNTQACPFKINDGKLSLQDDKTLDYETATSHTCIIQASDSPDSGALSTIITVFINVTDVNDNDPVFQHVIKSHNVSRDVGIPYTILANLTVTDADSGINAEIWFDIDNSTFAFDLKSYFDINAVSGEITIRKPLSDFPLESVNLTIVAHDRGEQVRTATVQIEVFVSDENTPPRFSQEVYSINITEEDYRALLEPLLTVRAYDFENQTLVNSCNCTYTILDAKAESGRNVSNYFSIDSSTGIISLTRDVLIDREMTGNSICVKLTVTDKGMPPKTATATLGITVWDVNDNAPLFSSDIVDTTITKSKCKHRQVIYNATARDVDIYPNNIISYRLNPHQSLSFTGIEISETTGELLLIYPNCSNENIENERILVVISATDGKYNTSLTISISVNLSDSNPNGPVFSKQLYSATVLSSDPNGTTLQIPDFGVTDNDGNNVTYAIEKNNLKCTEDVFRINSASGKITLQSKLDQFSLKAINLTITAADYGDFSPRYSKTGTTTVSVTVIDYSEKVCFATDKADELQSRADQFNVFRGLFIAIVLLWALTIVISVALFYKWRVVRYNLRAKQSDTHTFDFPPLHNDADKGSKGKADTTGLPPELPRREGSHGTSSGDSGFRNPAFTIDQDKDGYLAPSEHGTSTGQFSSADSMLSNLSLGSSRDTYAGGAAYMPLLPEGPSSFSQPTYLTPSSVIRGKADDPKGTYLHAVPEERGPDTPTYLHATVKPDDIQATFP